MTLKLALLLLSAPLCTALALSAAPQLLRTTAGGRAAIFLADDAGLGAFMPDESDGESDPKPAEKVSLQRMATDDYLPEETVMDEIVRREVSKAFENMDEKLLRFDGDSEAQIAFIKAKSAEVMEQVMPRVQDLLMAKLEADGGDLQADLEDRLKKLSAQRSQELLDKYETMMVGVREQMTKDRQAIRDEVRVLTELKESSAQIELPPPDRGKIVGGVAFVVGLTFLSAAINALLALGMGASDDFGGSLLTVGLNGACAAAGIGYWYTRRVGGAAEE